jgi:geranylgeranyl pyrophosphate synthase
VVGGDPERFRSWLAMPELLHVGSLIVDDVQDSSAVRRGGPSAHVSHGVPLAINAGSACYFLAEMPAADERLAAHKRVQVYEAYFQAVRAAHAGQALDIDGLAEVMPHVVATGDGALLERRLRATHRLKSAVPPSALARMAALIGDGTEAQVDGLGNLFEAFGIAFQIVDDVLNLKGFQRDLKTRGEDIREGKVTAPVAQAMSRLDRDARAQLWRTLSGKPSQPEVVLGVIETLAQCGALEACERQAREVIESAWARIDPLIPDSHAKIKLRAFGWYVLDRHY